MAASADLAAQLKLQDEAAQILQEERRKMGALNIDRVEAEAVLSDSGEVQGIDTRKKNRASDLIENFMVAANGVMARALQDAKVSSIRRVVKTPERWPRIVELAAQLRRERFPRSRIPERSMPFCKSEKRPIRITTPTFLWRW